jgi:hypothetical protein
MNVTLGQEDRRAVDLLLDRTATAASANSGAAHPVFATADTSTGNRVMRAQRLLSLLDQLPGEEPPADLIKRTLQLVEQFSQEQAGVRNPTPNLIASDRPHA